MSEYHISVLLDESVSALISSKSGIYADATFGGGGHTKAAGCSLKLPLEEGLPLIRQAVERSLQMYHE